VPIYNASKQQKKSEGSNHFGNSDVSWLVFFGVLALRRPIFCRWR
jgi:hypothetical protein